MAKIMLVEDDNNLREIYGARLQAEGHEIVAAKDGEEALALAVKEKPELIISDVMMPRISGFDMLDILRNAPETRNTKVIMMTALSQAEDKARADKLGADRYLVKSQVTLEDVAKVVKDVLSGENDPRDIKQDNTGSVATAAPTASVPDPVAPEPPTVPEPPVAPPVPEPPTPPAPAPEPPAAPVEPPLSNDSPAAASPTAPSPDITPLKSPELEAAEALLTAPPEPVAPPVPEPKKPEVVLPTPPDEVKAQPDEPPPTPDTSAEEPQTEEASVPSVGPSLEEALAAEEGNNGVDNNSSSTSDSQPAPTIMNGLEQPGLITPSKSEKIPEEPATEPVEDNSEVHAQPPTQLEVENAAHKRVIQPISDLTKKPDLDALLKAEEEKAAVVNPGAGTNISPAVAPAPTASDTAKHDDIAL